MKISIITLFPDLVHAYLRDALLAKAIGMKLLEVNVINLRDYSDNPYKSVDDKPFGGGDGMLLRADILEKALQSVQMNQVDVIQKVIYLSPQGQLLNQKMVQVYAQSEHTSHLILICGRYAGIDQRFIDKYVNQEISIGDYVLSGGELAALVFIESVSRFIPGVLGQLDSAENDSFKNNLLEAPQYTRPQIWNNLKVPDVLVSGNHQKIMIWKDAMSIQTTLDKRPDLLSEAELSVEQNIKLKALHA